MKGTSFVKFFDADGVLRNIRDKEKVADKIGMLLSANTGDIAFSESVGRDINTVEFMLDTESPEPVIRYQIQELIETNIEGARVREIDIQKSFTEYRIKIIVEYLGEEIRYDHTALVEYGV